MSKYVFYHIYCNEHTYTIVQQQVTNILFSGLYENIDKIYCFLTGSIDHISNIIELLQRNGEKYVIEKIGIDDTTYERFTIHQIRHYIRPEDKFLYIHSKGISQLPRRVDIIRDWRVYMEFFLMRHHEKCLKLLDTYDTVGVNLYKRPFIHYSGNFWWCRGSYFLTLPVIAPNYVEDRNYFTENYIGLNWPNAYCLFRADPEDHFDHYDTPYPPRNYI